jgi:hypothetical protein
VSAKTPLLAFEGECKRWTTAVIDEINEMTGLRKSRVMPAGRIGSSKWVHGASLDKG